jgi:hypothetical protein
MFVEKGLLGIVKPVGAGEVRKGEGTLASPIEGENDAGRRNGRWATQASPLHTTLPPPLRIEASSQAYRYISGWLMLKEIRY